MSFWGKVRCVLHAEDHKCNAELLRGVHPSLGSAPKLRLALAAKQDLEHARGLVAGWEIVAAEAKAAGVRNVYYHMDIFASCATGLDSVYVCWPKLETMSLVRIRCNVSENRYSTVLLDVRMFFPSFTCD